MHAYGAGERLVRCTTSAPSSSMIEILQPSGIATLARENITLHTPLYTRVCHTFGRTLLRSLLDSNRTRRSDRHIGFAGLAAHHDMQRSHALRGRRGHNHTHDTKYSPRTRAHEGVQTSRDRHAPSRALPQASPGASITQVAAPAAHVTQPFIRCYGARGCTARTRRPARR